GRGGRRRDGRFGAEQRELAPRLGELPLEALRPHELPAEAGEERQRHQPHHQQRLPVAAHGPPPWSAAVFTMASIARRTSAAGRPDALERMLKTSSPPDAVVR